MPVIDQVFRLAHLPEPDIQPDTVGSRSRSRSRSKLVSNARSDAVKGPPNAPSMAGVADSPASASDDVRE